MRGIVESASPLRARWLSDEDCDDPFSLDVLRALHARRRLADCRWPDGKEGKMPVLGPVGGGRSPSTVWHAQAAGVLLKLGFLPTAQCVQEHLAVIERRLDPQNCFDPSGRAQENRSWVLRPRHVAWVVACLSEMSPIDLAAVANPAQRVELEEAAARHRAVVRRALSYLLGESNEVPWVGPRGPARDWAEWWADGKPNLLSTLYAMLAICRAERHGFASAESSSAAISLSTAQVGRLLDKVEVVSSAAGLAVRWNYDWPERWALPHRRATLPDGVVGLLALVLVEYSSLLFARSERPGEEELRGLRAHLQAQRLGHVLLARAANERDAATWICAADAFTSEKAEGTWFIPSYSVCVCAILETGVADFRHKVVADAFSTIEALAIEEPGTLSAPVDTWIDPTRTRVVRKKGESLPGLTMQKSFSGHRQVDLRPQRADTSVYRYRVTASGIHSAVMAYVSLRRSLAEADPRLNWRRRSTPPLPTSPFEQLEFASEEGKQVIRLSGPRRPVHEYVETARLTPESAYVLQALTCLRNPATADAIGGEVTRLAAGRRHAETPKAIADRILNINKQLGVRLIETVGAGDERRYTLTAELVGG